MGRVRCEKGELFEDGGGFNHIRAQLPNVICASSSHFEAERREFATLCGFPIAA
jgi:hypothetical protein